MVEEMKLKLFEEMEALNELANMTTYDNRNYFEQAEGAYKMLKILGIHEEYIKWSIAKYNASKEAGYETGYIE